MIKFHILLTFMVALPGLLQATTAKTIEFRMPSLLTNAHKPTLKPGQRVEEDFIQTPVEMGIEATVSPSVFITPEKARRATSVSKEQKLDSVSRTFVDGNKVSVQEFEYTKLGQPLKASNYIYEGSEKSLYSVYLYTYDDLNRLVSGENTNYADPSQSVRYDYFYSDDSTRYTTVIYSAVNPDTNLLTILQKATYDYDRFGNVVNQEFYVTYDGGDTWAYFQKAEASYLENGVQTAYYNYNANETADAWVGDKAESYIYTPDGKDARITGYYWENNAWLEYKRDDFTYREDGQLKRQDTSFWNREKQDWNGYDNYNNYLERNYYSENDFDDDNRITAARMYKMSSTDIGKFINIQNEFYSYETLDNGELLINHETHLQWEGPQPSLYSREIMRHNSFGRETYYKSFNYTSGFEKALDEQIRDIDDNNIYRTGWLYSFTTDKANTRYGLLKVEYTFATADPTVFQPTQQMQWKGAGRNTDTGWNPESRMEYYWNEDMDGEFTQFFQFKYDKNGKEYPSTGYTNEYDLTIDIDKVCMWNIANKSKNFYNYKTLNETNWRNRNNDGEWDNDFSYIDTFHYSELEPAGINETQVSAEAIEVARYDLLGRLLPTAQQGINIVLYSDGTARKIMVK